MKKSKREIKLIKENLKDKGIGELKKIIVELTPKKIATKKDILERDGYLCTFCGDNNDLEIHHVKPRRLGGLESSDNLTTACHYCHWYIHANPKFRICHASLVKEGIKKAKESGSILGRKKFSEDKINRIKILRTNGESIRNISREVGCSVGFVHKVLNKVFKDKQLERIEQTPTKENQDKDLSLS